MNNKIILDIFHQSSDCGIPAHWCVQYKTKDNSFAKYEHFNTYTEASEYAMKYGYND